MRELNPASPFFETKPASFLKGWRGWIAVAWRWAVGHCVAPGLRRLKLQESLSLGEKRFVAVLECDGQRFLLGGTATSLELLSTLPPRVDRQYAEEGGLDR